MTTIDYYFSLNSPWSYMGSARLAKMASESGATVNATPADMSAVFPQTGGLPLPKRSAERQAYRMMELKRWRVFNDIPLILEPAYFPHDESEGVRLIYAAKTAGGDAHGLATEIGRMMWEEDRDPADPQVQNDAAQRVGLDAEALRGALSMEDAMKIWAKESEDAIAKGVFGVPSYVIDGEVFWGQDRLDFVERKLKG